MMAEASGSRTHHRYRKITIAGFEDRDDHRTACASASTIKQATNCYIRGLFWFANADGPQGLKPRSTLGSERHGFNRAVTLSASYRSVSCTQGDTWTTRQQFYRRELLTCTSHPSP
jgi:hypothetical protein